MSTKSCRSISPAKGRPVSSKKLSSNRQLFQLFLLPPLSLFPGNKLDSVHSSKVERYRGEDRLPSGHRRIIVFLETVRNSFKSDYPAHRTSTRYRRISTVSGRTLPPSSPIFHEFYVRVTTLAESNHLSLPLRPWRIFVILQRVTSRSENTFQYVLGTGIRYSRYDDRDSCFSRGARNLFFALYQFPLQSGALVFLKFSSMVDDCRGMDDGGIFFLFFVF